MITIFISFESFAVNWRMDFKEGHTHIVHSHHLFISFISPLSTSYHRHHRRYRIHHHHNHSCHCLSVFRFSLEINLFKTTTLCERDFNVLIEAIIFFPTSKCCIHIISDLDMVEACQCTGAFNNHRTKFRLVRMVNRFIALANVACTIWLNYVSYIVFATPLT